MKRSKYVKWLAILGVIAVLCMGAGCGGNGGETGESGAASGTSAEADSTAQLIGQWQSENLPDYIYTFNADGTGQYDMAGNILELTYTVQDGKITMTFLTQGYQPVTLAYVLDGDRLNIKDSFGSDTFYNRVQN